MREGPCAPQTTHHRDCFFKTLNTSECIVLSNTGNGVVLFHPSGTQTHHEAAVRQEIDRCCFFCKHHWVAEVVSCNQRSYLKCFCCCSSCHESWYRSKLLGVMVVHLQGDVTKVFSLLGNVCPFFTATCGLCFCAEFERFKSSHSLRLPISLRRQRVPLCPLHDVAQDRQAPWLPRSTDTPVVQPD